MGKRNKGYDNLIPAAHTLTVGEQSVGGKKSGEVRRNKAGMKELANQIANAPITSQKTRAQLENFGIDSEDMTNSAMVVASVFQGAVKGDMKAVEKWQELTEAVNADGKPYELPARVLGKAFIRFFSKRLAPRATKIGR